MPDKSFDFFRGNKEFIRIYNQLICELNILPKLIIKKRKSYNKMVVFCSHRNFAYISLLDENSSFIDTGFKIIFSTSQKIHDTRITLITEPHEGQFSHHVMIKNIEDINNQLIEWLKQSYNNAL